VEKPSENGGTILLPRKMSDQRRGSGCSLPSYSKVVYWENGILINYFYSIALKKWIHEKLLHEKDWNGVN
jgi:hypothetical protein